MMNQNRQMILCCDRHLLVCSGMDRLVCSDMDRLVCSGMDRWVCSGMDRLVCSDMDRLVCSGMDRLACLGTDQNCLECLDKCRQSLGLADYIQDYTPVQKDDCLDKDQSLTAYELYYLVYHANLSLALKSRVI